MESIYWYVILASGAIIIIALGGLTIYYRNKLEKCEYRDEGETPGV